MQQSMQATRTGSGRREERVREERVPLEAPIEVRIEDSSEPRKADGLNVSIGGLAMRATSVPPLGATVACRFACPPAGESITAKGEVVWSSQGGAAPGSFGVRFVELDTKSATCLRRYLGPRGELTEASGRLRSATIRIDGLGPSVEAELKLADETRVVLEQELSFLQLGRAVEVSVQGRGTERGRIASVELRRSNFDVPTIVYNLLLDAPTARDASAPDAGTTPAAAPSSPALTESAELPIAARMSMLPVLPPGEPEWVTGRVASPPRGSSPRRSEAPSMRVSAAPRRDTVLAAPVPPPPPAELPDERTAMVAPPPAEPAARIPVSAAHSHARISTQVTLPASPGEDARSPDAAHLDAAGANGADEDEDTSAAGGRDEASDDTLYDEPRLERPGPMAMLRGLPLQVGLLTRALSARVRELASARGARVREQGEALDPTDERTRWLLRIARLRAFLLAAWSWLRGLVPGEGGHASSRPPLRMQRATLPGAGPGEGSRFEPSQRIWTIAGALAVIGVGLGIYALAPRGVSSDLEVPKPPEPQPAAVPSEGEEPIVLEMEGPHEALEPEPGAPPAKRAAPKVVKNAELPTAGESAAPAHELGDGEEVALDRPVAAAQGASTFGDREVPNGRVFTLRMNGPVEVVQGEAREHGFTVRIPGRVAADRASPIASAHSAVSRAMILNRPGFAELTIDFGAGQLPRYQVRGKGNVLEITLERL